LVVIAIIGILASIILASLNSARAKGTDAATKSDLDNSRAQAELYYDGNNNSYLGACAAGATAANEGINAMLVDAASKASLAAPVVTATTAGTATTVICHDSAGAWAAAVPLKSVTGTAGAVVYWCVDSTGASKQDANTLTGSGVNQYVCP
jgi:type II secretory pathway pseudopilin PulG